MAGRLEQYREELRRRRDWEPYLKANSGLPGPRGNLELVEAVGDVASPARLWRWSASPDEFLAVCGTAGLGQSALNDERVLPRLMHLAADPRWRVREAVAIALQRLGKQDMARLVAEMEKWADGDPYVQRAAAAALCEPALLRDPKDAKRVLNVLDGITHSVTASRERRTDAFRVLRQALGYCWSVAAAAAPAAGRPMVDRWLRSDDPDVRWIMRSNLGKARMSALGPAWVAAKRQQIEA